MTASQRNWGGDPVPGGHVQLVSLTKRFTEIAVDNVDLTVDSGEFLSLLGPSGCGQTTTLRLIAGFEQPTCGRILLDGVARWLVDRPDGRGNALAVRKMRVANALGSMWRRRGPGQVEIVGLRTVVAGLSVIGGRQWPVAMSS
jgi:energy-coupling factor transporter ATP-binding protein EcfA2